MARAGRSPDNARPRALFRIAGPALKKSDFHFDLPPELIAQAPLAVRSDSRLLVVPPAPEAFADRGIRDLPSFLQAGDLLVFNDTRVIPARLFGTKETGGRVEILLERITGAHDVRAQIGASKSPKPGSRITLDEGTALTVLGRDGEFYRLHFDTDEPLDKVLLRAGRMPLPPYISTRRRHHRRRALPDGVRPPHRCGGGADRRPAFRRGAAGDVARQGRGLRPRHPARRCRHVPADARRIAWATT